VKVKPENSGTAIKDVGSPEFYRIKICESETSETQYWLEVIVKLKWLSWEKVKCEYEERGELLAIFTSIGKK